MMKKVLAGILAAAMAVSLAACGGNAGSSRTADAPAEAKEEAPAQAVGTAQAAAADSEAGSGGLKFGVTYWTASDFFQTIAESIEEEASRDGNAVVVTDAGQDSAKQIEIVENFISQGVDAVFLNPVDRDAITPALKALNDAGIPVINFDSSVAALDMVNAYVATDNYAQKARAIGAKVLLITASPEASLAKLSDKRILLRAGAKGQASNDSIQPMGSLFEQSLGILCDIIVLYLMEKYQITGSQMFERHANLE